MRGHVRKRGNRWAIVVDVGRDEHGKRKQKWHSGFERRKDAERALADIVSRLDAGGYVEPSRMTVGAFLTDEWLPAIRASVRPSTFESYARNVRVHVVPRLGQVPLQRLTPATLNAFYAELGRDGRRDGRALSPRSARYIHAILRKALADAIRWGHVPRNVATLADPPSAGASGAREMKTWTAGELRRFLDHVADDRLYALWRLLATTGMRRGEALGLG